ncbi:MAG: hypothetical protein B6244_12055 [Candidatus Cloacimonetes bacterium 4572_55]|nr:MAG: hypothetical protein B6244_12055 [Candidatus Cloacimonetes bacterium 4572_55]
MCNQLILGDNLEIMKTLPSESIDLIYIDPPFFSNRNYAVIWGDKGEIRSFKDIWSGGIETYINWLYERVEEIHRLLKPTGSFYLHCDWHANAYIRVHILDKIFGEKNFRNEIIWIYDTAGRTKKNFNRKHDNIFWYSKNSKKWTFNGNVKGVGIERKASNHMRLGEDKNGRKFYEKTDKNTGKVYRWYLDKFKIRNDCWKDIKAMNSEPADIIFLNALNRGAKERIGYPTQKPEALLERIILVSSDENDTVADFFVGGGTTIIVAERLNRNWIGVDSSVAAIKVTENRLYKEKNLFQRPFSVKIHKYDFDNLNNMNAFEFEHFAIEQFGGIPNKKQRSDLGIDGIKIIDNEKFYIQVKQSKKIGRNVVDNFKSAIDRKKSKNGFILAWSFGRGAISEIARLKREDNYNIQLIEIKTFIPISKKPKIDVNIENQGNTFKFDAAKTESEIGIEFFSWDFDFKDDFKPDILLDKTGFAEKKFKKGKYKVACKCVDLDGLDNIEIIDINVNS